MWFLIRFALFTVSHISNYFGSAKFVARIPDMWVWIHFGISGICKVLIWIRSCFVFEIFRIIKFQNRVRNFSNLQHFWFSLIRKLFNSDSFFLNSESFLNCSEQQIFCSDSQFSVFWIFRIPKLPIRIYNFSNLVHVALFRIRKTFASDLQFFFGIHFWIFRMREFSVRIRNFVLFCFFGWLNF